ncbi:SDR family NAD(P)-dependent oxidoreductase [Sphingomonas oligophenolica]
MPALRQDAQDRAGDPCDAAVTATIERFGCIDVLVNTAGYGYQATVEEGEDAEIRAQFDANVFGLFAMTRAVLPILRKQRSGHIIKLSSVAGFNFRPGSGYYAASKHAVDGWSDSSHAEVTPLALASRASSRGRFVPIGRAVS